ncbi:MAG: hypothetical protein AMXMBFR33_12600 [Candidatus Xenobia bacterium]
MLQRYGYVAETLLLYLVLWFIGAVFTPAHDFAFLGLMLHPYLLVIVLEAIHYGRTEALFASFVGVAAYIAGMMSVGQTLHVDRSTDAVIIFTLVATGFVLGTTQQARNRQLSQARAELEELRAESERQRQRVNVLTAANRELNDRVLGEVSTVQSFSELARRLSVLDEKDLNPAICELVCDYLGASESSLYLLKGQKLNLAATRGWDSVSEEAASLAPGNDLLWSAVQKKQTVTARDLESPPPDGPDPERRYRRLICAPIINPGNGNVIGVISVDALPFARFHSLSVKVLGVIARWAGDSFYNASLFRGVTSQLAGDDLMEDCLPPIVFRDRLTQMAVQRDGSQGLVSVRVQGLHELPVREQKELRRNLYTALKQCMLHGDILGMLQDGHYALLVRRDPNWGPKLRDAMVTSLKQGLGSSLNGSLKVKVATADFASSGQDVDEVLHALHDQAVEV